MQLSQNGLKKPKDSRKWNRTKLGLKTKIYLYPIDSKSEFRTNAFEQNGEMKLIGYYCLGFSRERKKVKREKEEKNKTKYDIFVF